MKNGLFQELLESVKQGAAIMKGESQPSRTFEFSETEVHALREQFGLSQDKFANLVGIREVLTVREADLREGKESFTDWETAKDQLRDSLK